MSDVQNWWVKNPMTYDRTHGRSEIELGTRDFFDAVDQKFFSWNKPLHGAAPFDRLFPFDQYVPGSRILEIGCGMGSMAMLWAKRGMKVTAVDLNQTSIEQTKKRFNLHALDGEIKLEDARSLSFPDQTFDYVYSWGVLHHSPEIEKSLVELMRVLRPGGGFGLMLYNRRSLWHWYMTEYIEGFLHYENQFLDPLTLASRYGDGAREEGNPHTWPVTKTEIISLLSPYSNDVSAKTLGTDLDGLFKLMLPGLGFVLPVQVKKVWARRLGWSLWFHGHKKGHNMPRS